MSLPADRKAPRSLVHNELRRALQGEEPRQALIVGDGTGPYRVARSLESERDLQRSRDMMNHYPLSAVTVAGGMNRRGLVVVASAASRTGSLVCGNDSGGMKGELFHVMCAAKCRIYRPHARAALTGHVDRSVRAVRDSKDEAATVWTNGRPRSASHGIGASKNVSYQRSFLRRSALSRALAGTGVWRGAHGADFSTGGSGCVAVARRMSCSMRACRSSLVSRTRGMSC